MNESPVKKALDTLHKLKNKETVPEEEISAVIQVLIANKEIYQPDFAKTDEENKNIDDETKAWVVETFLQSHYKADGEEAPVPRPNMNKRMSIMMVRKNSHELLSVPMNRTQGDSNDKGLDTILSTSNHDIRPLQPLHSMQRRTSKVPSIKPSMQRIYDSSIKSLIENSSSQTSMVPSLTNPNDRRASQITNSTPDHFAVEPGQEDKKEQRYQLYLKTLQEIDHTTVNKYIDTKYNTWDFNIFELEEMSKGNALYFTGLYVMHKYGLIEHFKIPVNVAQDWLLVLFIFIS